MVFDLVMLLTGKIFMGNAVQEFVKIESGRLLIDVFDMFTRIKFNNFVPDAPFLYPMKTSENLAVFLCFQGVKKGGIDSKWINEG